MVRSRFSMFTPWGGRPLLRLADGADLLRNVDSHRTPGDAPSAANAPRGAELIDPRRQLVRHPLAVASAGRGTNAPTVDVRERHGETGVPLAPALRMFARQVGDIFDRRAE